MLQRTPLAHAYTVTSWQVANVPPRVYTAYGAHMGTSDRESIPLVLGGRILRSLLLSRFIIIVCHRFYDIVMCIIAHKHTRAAHVFSFGKPWSRVRTSALCTGNRRLAIVDTDTRSPSFCPWLRESNPPVSPTYPGVRSGLAPLQGTRRGCICMCAKSIVCTGRRGRKSSESERYFLDNKHSPRCSINVYLYDAELMFCKMSSTRNLS